MPVKTQKWDLTDKKGAKMARKESIEMSEVELIARCLTLIIGLEKRIKALEEDIKSLRSKNAD